MSCFKPLIGIDRGFKDGKRDIKILPNGSISSEAFDPSIRVFDIPCGHCIGCRRAQAKEWSNRLILESLDYDYVHFLTLTYCEEYMRRVNYFDDQTGIEKEAGTLCKSDVQYFMKRLREYVYPEKIRFFCCGEYGSKTDRPHYHFIIYGLPEKMFHFVPDGRSETGDVYFRSPEIEKIWCVSDKFDMPKHMNYEAKKYGLNDSMIGKVQISPASEYCMRYVAGYVTKKIGCNDNHYKMQNRVPPFTLCSRKPGIGKKYLDSNPDSIYADQIVIGTENGMVKMKIPRYFKKQLQIVDPDEFYRRSDKGIEDAAVRRYNDLSQTDLYEKDFLKVQDEVMRSRDIVRDLK